MARMAARIGSVLRRVLAAGLREAQNALRVYRRRSARPTLQKEPSGVPQEVCREAPCYFVLSTGRCGTELLTKLLAKNIRCDVHHTPQPELLYGSKLAYLKESRTSECLEEIVLHTRYELIREAYITGGIYIETNNRITFYAHALSMTFKKAKFIHLVRHPGDFVRSALRRGYFQGIPTDEGRITPRENDPASERWATMTDVGKAAWLWNETQAFIEEFKRTLPEERYVTIRAEDLFDRPDATIQIFRFLDLEPPRRSKIRRRIAVPVNRETRKHSVPRWRSWPADWKVALRNEAKLSSLYSYELG